MRPRRTYVDYVRDIVSHAQKAEQFVAGLDFAAFCANEEKVFAVIRALEVIGEAARHLPLSLRRRYAEIPWRNVIGMRNILIHGYFGVDVEVIWKTVHESLPPLRAVAEQMLADLGVQDTGSAARE